MDTTTIGLQMFQSLTGRQPTDQGDYDRVLAPVNAWIGSGQIATARIVKFVIAQHKVPSSADEVNVWWSNGGLTVPVGSYQPTARAATVTVPIATTAAAAAASGPNVSGFTLPNQQQITDWLKQPAVLAVIGVLALTMLSSKKGWR